MRDKTTYIFYLSIAYLLLSYALVVAIDVFDVFDLRTRWLTGDEERFFFWFHWFDVPIEPMQWTLLATVSLTFFVCAWLARRDDNPDQRDFSLLLGLGTLLMLMEDYGDPRHIIRQHIELMAGRDTIVGYDVLGTFVELAYFGLLGGLLVYAFVAYRNVFWDKPKIRKFLFIGYACYAVAVGSSWLGTAFHSTTDAFLNLYTLVGDVFMNVLFITGGETERLYMEMSQRLLESHGLPLSFWFMDRVYEESFELVGGAALVVAALSFFYQLRDGDNQ